MITSHRCCHFGWKYQHLCHSKQLRQGVQTGPGRAAGPREKGEKRDAKTGDTREPGRNGWMSLGSQAKC